jgi:hypothetical protein
MKQVTFVSGTINESCEEIGKRNSNNTYFTDVLKIPKGFFDDFLELSWTLNLVFMLTINSIENV